MQNVKVISRTSHPEEAVAETVVVEIAVPLERTTIEEFFESVLSPRVNGVCFRALDTRKLPVGTKVMLSVAMGAEAIKCLGGTIAEAHILALSVDFLEITSTVSGTVQVEFTALA